MNKPKEKEIFLPEFPGYFDIFAVIRKTKISMKRKPSNSESALSKTIIEDDFNRKKKKKYFSVTARLSRFYRGDRENHNSNYAETVKL